MWAGRGLNLNSCFWLHARLHLWAEHGGLGPLCRHLSADGEGATGAWLHPLHGQRRSVQNGSLFAVPGVFHSESHVFPTQRPYVLHLLLRGTAPRNLVSVGEAPFCRDGVHLDLPDLSSSRPQNPKFLALLFSNHIETRAEGEKLYQETFYPSWFWMISVLFFSCSLDEVVRDSKFRC